jgi:NADPH2:quinone reductase
MISYWIHKEGTGTVLERREQPTPQLEGNEMLVRMEAASFNRGDIMGRIGRHSAAQARPAGVDGCGLVVDPGTSGFREGDRVLFRSHGCFAHYAAVDPALAARVPSNFSPEQAAAIPGAFITAWEGLIQYGRARRDDWVVLCGASSGVGVAALQIAKNLGARVIAVSGSPNKLETLRRIGADAVITARGGGYGDEVRRITSSHGADVCLNMVGASAFPDSIQAAANFGRVVMVGYVDGQLRAECDLEAVHGRRLEISGISNTALTPAQRALAMQGFMRDVFPAIESGAIKPVIDRVFPFDELPAAKAYVETDQLIGKVIVRMQ